MIKINIFTLALVAVALMSVPSAKASYSLSFKSSNYQGSYKSSYSGGGDLICQYYSNGRRTGSLCDSYDWTYSPNCINYRGGDSAQGVCLVAKDSWGNCYSWNICDWNGIDQIICNLGKNFNCREIDIYGCCKNPCNPPPPSCVPEPSTLFAGAMLLLPMGVTVARRVYHRRKLAVM